MFKFVIRVIIGVPVLIAGIIVMSMGAQTDTWVISFPFACIAIFITVFSIGVFYKAWKIFRGG